MTTQIVKLDVGGTVFKTSLFTLSQHDSMLKTLLTTGMPVERDENGCVFIDRDSKYFRLILNFLRDGFVDLPETRSEVLEILAEAKYYLLQTLIDCCEERLRQTYIPNYYVVTFVVEARKFIFGSDKPVIVLRLPINIGTTGIVSSYYFSEKRFEELADQHHESITFVLVTEAEFTEDCSWSFFLQNKRVSIRVKGPSDNNMIEDCMWEVLEDAKRRRQTHSKLV
uniref:BTB domain-containing protein n=1 Tax=Caenorhabditis japonica TaxID=281687 RepID=A0A8R1I6Q3_CAEJA